MPINIRNFDSRPATEQAGILKDTWCDQCNLADLGMTEPIEFEENGLVFVEGKCSKCGGIVCTQIIVRELE